MITPIRNRRITGGIADVWIERAQDNVWDKASEYDRLHGRLEHADPADYPYLEDLHVRLSRLAWHVFACTGVQLVRQLAVSHDQEKNRYRSPARAGHPRDQLPAQRSAGIIIMLVHPPEAE